MSSEPEIKLTPTQELIIDLLVSRIVREGHPSWVIPKGLTYALHLLSAMGYLSYESDEVQGYWRVSLTEQGKAQAEEDYQSPQDQRIADLRELCVSLSSRESRLITEARALDAKLELTLSTSEHHRVVVAGLPFCSCGHDLQGARGLAFDVWLDHRLDEVRGLVLPPAVIIDHSQPRVRSKVRS